MLGGPTAKLVLLQQPLNWRCELSEGRYKQPETGQQAVYVLHIPNGFGHIFGVNSGLQLSVGRQSPAYLQLISQHFHASNKEMLFGSIDHKTSASQALKHQFRLLPNAGRVRSVNNYVVKVHDQGNVPTIYDSSYCALEMHRGVCQPKL